MSGFIGGLIVVFSAYCCGRALLPTRHALSRSRYEELTTSILLGTGGLIVMGMAAVFTLGTFSFISAATLSLATLIVGGIKIRREWSCSHHLAPCAFPLPQRPLMLLLGIGSVAMTLAWPLNEFDPILHFGLKGKLLFAGESIRGESFNALNGEFGRIMTHPNYPLGLPILEAWSAHFAGVWSDRWVQFPLAFWSFSLPGAIAFGMRRFGERAAARGALIAACTPILYVMNFLHKGVQDFEQAGLGAEKMLGGRGDLPVAAFIGLAAACFLRANKRANLLAGLALAAAVLCKNEGLAMVGVFAIAAGLSWTINRFEANKHSGKAIIISLAVFTLCAGSWLWHRTSLPAIDENYTEAMSIENVIHYFQEDETADASPINPKLYGAEWSDYSHWRPARIGRYFWNVFSDWLSWGLLWLLFAIGIFRASQDFHGRTIALWVIGGLTLYALILLVTPWFLIALHQKGIPARLILHLIGPVAIVAAWPSRKDAFME